MTGFMNSKALTFLSKLITHLQHGQQYSINNMFRPIQATTTGMILGKQTGTS
jgi:hypothetical protein